MSMIRNAVFALSLMSAGFAFGAGPVDINSADAETLAQTINGVGINKAEAIVAYRDQHGAFQSVDDLARVRGIGLRTVERNRTVLSVGEAAAALAAPAAP